MRAANDNDSFGSNPLATVWKDFSGFPAISLMQWTFLDGLERYWMAGRVGIELTTI